MSRDPEICTVCERVVSGGRDTFGWFHRNPVCAECHLWLWSVIEEQDGQDVYGLAPHHHDLSITGSMIGSTVFESVQSPDAYGRIDCGDRWFYPDADAGGLAGVYSPKSREERMGAAAAGG